MFFFVIMYDVATCVRDKQKSDVFLLCVNALYYSFNDDNNKHIYDISIVFVVVYSSICRLRLFGYIQSCSVQ